MTLQQIKAIEELTQSKLTNYKDFVYTFEKNVIKNYGYDDQYGYDIKLEISTVNERGVKYSFRADDDAYDNDYLPIEWIKQLAEILEGENNE